MLIDQTIEAPDQPLAVHKIASQSARLGEETQRLWRLLESKAAAEAAQRRAGK